MLRVGGLPADPDAASAWQVGRRAWAETDPPIRRLYQRGFGAYALAIL